MAKTQTWFKQSDDSYVKFKGYELRDKRGQSHSDEDNMRVYVRKGLDDWYIFVENIDIGSEAYVDTFPTKAEAIKRLRAYTLANPVTKVDKSLRFLDTRSFSTYIPEYMVADAKKKQKKSRLI